MIGSESKISKDLKMNSGNGERYELQHFTGGR